MKFHSISCSALVLLSLSIVACSTEVPDTPAAQLDVIATASKLPEMNVHKSPTCGCCKSWISYIEKAGFVVHAHDHDNLDEVKTTLGMTNPELKSCHTAVIDDYIIEGHVPLADIDRLLAERPDIAGLTAPGMPVMSPGMGSEIPKDYDVLAFDKEGNSYVFSSY